MTLADDIASLPDVGDIIPYELPPQPSVSEQHVSDHGTLKSILQQFNTVVIGVPEGLQIEYSGELEMSEGILAGPEFKYRSAAAVSVTGGTNGDRGDSIDPDDPVNSLNASFANIHALFMEGPGGLGIESRGSHHLLYGRGVIGEHPDGDVYGEMGFLVASVTNNRPGALAETIETALIANEAGRNAIQVGIMNNNTAIGDYWARGLWLVSAGTVPAGEGLLINGPGGWENYLRFQDALGTDVLRVDFEGVMSFIGGTSLTPNGSNLELVGNFLSSAVIRAESFVEGSQFRFAGDTARNLRWGTGSPEGVVAASVGCVFLRADGGAATVLYIKESGTGNTGWVAK